MSMSIHNCDLCRTFEEFYDSLKMDGMGMMWTPSISIEFSFESELIQFCKRYNFNTLFACEVDGVEYRLVRRYVPGD